jgi:hypothetical protein
MNAVLDAIKLQGTLCGEKIIETGGRYSWKLNPLPQLGLLLNEQRTQI